MTATPNHETVATADDASEPELQVIAVQIGRELFCLDILAVREIVRTGEFAVTRVPNAHDYVQGVVNLRGKVVPVVDLSRRLGLTRDAESRSARFVVVEVDDAIVGLTVDSVSEVLRLPRSTFAGGGDDGLVGTVNGRIMTLLDPRRLLARRDAGPPGDAADG